MSQVSERVTQLSTMMIYFRVQCAPYFVRCIKPNDVKQPKKFNNKMVLDQLRYSGMLETIRIRRAGYPVRIEYSNFIFRFVVCRHLQFCLSLLNNRFRVLLGAVKAPKSPKETASMILLHLPPVFNDSYQLGQTKVFFREVR